jgi:hypothetical protein
VVVVGRLVLVAVHLMDQMVARVAAEIPLAPTAAHGIQEYVAEVAELLDKDIRVAVAQVLL